MSVSVVFNGSTYLIPTTGETDWSSTVTAFLADVGGNAMTLTSTQTVTNKVLQLQAGTAGAPSLSFVGSTSTGLYSPTTDQIALATSGVQRLVVNAAGLVTIPNIALTGGSIDGTTIGGITPSTANFTTASATGSITVGSGGGFITANAGDATHTGYIGLFNAASTRKAYIGFTGPENLLNLVCEAGTTGVGITGNLSVSSAIFATSSVTSHASSGSASLNSDGVGRGYISFTNASGVGQGYFGYLNGSSLDITGLNSATSINISPALIVTGTATISSNATVGGNLQVNNDAFVTGQTISTGYVHGKAGVYSATDATMFLRNDGTYRYLQMAASWNWNWNTSNGVLGWNTPSGGFFQINSVDSTIYNYFGPFAGNGAYWNFSDVRLKTNVEDFKRGLDEVLALQPVSFIRIDKRKPIEPTDTVSKPHKAMTREVGFLAQDVKKHIPEAVQEFSADETEEPMLAVQTDTVLAALVNAVKELSARIQVLESK